MTSKVSLDKSKIKFVLLEGVHQSALRYLYTPLVIPILIIMKSVRWR